MILTGKACSLAQWARQVFRPALFFLWGSAGCTHSNAWDISQFFQEGRGVCLIVLLSFVPVDRFWSCDQVLFLLTSFAGVIRFCTSDPVLLVLRGSIPVFRGWVCRLLFDHFFINEVIVAVGKFRRDFVFIRKNGFASF